MNPRSRLSKSQSKSFARRRRDQIFWKFGLAAVAVLAWIFVLSRLSWLGIFSITNVQVYGADPDIVGNLRSAALNELQGAYAGLFARSNSAFYPKRDIESAVTNASARISGVDIHRTGIHGLAITVAERVPAAVVCAELPDFSSGVSNDSSCYFADAKGFIFMEAPTSTPQIFERYYAPDLAGVQNSVLTPSGAIGSYATSTREFTDLQSFMEAVHAAHIATFGILMKDNGEYELYIGNPASVAHVTNAPADNTPDIAVVYFNDRANFQNEFSDLISFWDKETETGHSAGPLPRFESIDLRYGSNVFYRLEK